MKNKIKMTEDDWEAYARKRYAWSQYVTTMNHLRIEENEIIIKNTPDNEREAKRMELEKEIPNTGKIYIG